MPQNTDQAQQLGVNMAADDREGLKTSMQQREDEIVARDAAKAMQGE